MGWTEAARKASARARRLKNTGSAKGHWTDKYSQKERDMVADYQSRQVSHYNPAKATHTPGSSPMKATPYKPKKKTGHASGRKKFPY